MPRICLKSVGVNKVYYAYQVPIYVTHLLLIIEQQGQCYLYCTDEETGAQSPNHQRSNAEVRLGWVAQ